MKPLALCLLMLATLTGCATYYDRAAFAKAMEAYYDKTVMYPEMRFNPGSQ